ncbi:MAG: alkaline phosphatase [Gemmatimonadota bacterium]|jgi:alkaline phosphatase
MIMRIVPGVAFLAVTLLQTPLQAQEPAPAPKEGSVIFVHPDGAGVAAWGAARLLTVGPDGTMNWDRLGEIGIYRGHMKSSMGATSHGGATSHAYGVKVHWDSYGMDGTEPLTSLSGKPYSILKEAQEAGLATALVNSGHIAEPGTGVFAASAPARDASDIITRQIIESGTDIILSGGEILLLPEGVEGTFMLPGVRKDSLNLIDRARELGYEVVYSRDELLALPPETEKVLGVFGAAHTFWDRSEEVLAERGLSLYSHWAPSVAEMTETALTFLKSSGRRFLMVVEEEGSDNFANNNNAIGALTALARADQAIGVALDYVEENPNTLLITTADSDAGGMEVYPIRSADSLVAETPLPPTTRNGGMLDGRNGTQTPPFMSEPDRFGNQWPFGIAWASFDDNLGGIVAKAHGLNAELLPNNVDNTDIYRMMYATLFGIWLN